MNQNCYRYNFHGKRLWILIQIPIFFLDPKRFRFTDLNKVKRISPVSIRRCDRTVTLWHLGLYVCDGDSTSIHARCTFNQLFVIITYIFAITGRRCQHNGPLTRYVKLRVVHAPRMPRTFSRYRGLAIPTCFTARAWRSAMMHTEIAY